MSMNNPRGPLLFRTANGRFLAGHLELRGRGQLWKIARLEEVAHVILFWMNAFDYHWRAWVLHAICMPHPDPVLPLSLQITSTPDPRLASGTHRIPPPSSVSTCPAADVIETETWPGATGGF